MRVGSQAQMVQHIFRHPFDVWIAKLDWALLWNCMLSLLMQVHLKRHDPFNSEDLKISVALRCALTYHIFADIFVLSCSLYTLWKIDLFSHANSVAGGADVVCDCLRQNRRLSYTGCSILRATLLKALVVPLYVVVRSSSCVHLILLVKLHHRHFVQSHPNFVINYLKPKYLSMTWTRHHSYIL
jgi:hypothetical protein